MNRLIKRGLLVPAVLVVGLIFISFTNYPLFHVLAEFFAVTVAIIAAVVIWQTHPFAQNHYLMYIGCGYAWIAALDIVHALTYKGMAIYPDMGANAATQFWIAARYFEACIMLTAPFFFQRAFNRYAVMALFGVLAALLYGLIDSGNFPDAFIEGRGLTTFKVASEYIIIAMLAVALYLLWRSRRFLDGRALVLISVSIVFTMIAELAFTFYVSVYGLSNLVGHVFKIFSYWLIFEAIVILTLLEPVDRTRRRLLNSLREREDREEELRRSRERYRLVADNSPDMIYRMSLPDGAYSYVSPAAEEIFGYPPEAWIENPKLIVDLIHPDWREYFATEWERLLRGENPPTYEYQVVHKSGQIRWLNQRNYLEKDDTGRAAAIVGVVTDVTDRNRLEDELKLSETRFRDISESSSDWIWEVDREGRYTYVSSGVEDILGYAPEEVLGRTPFEFIRKQEAEEVRAKFNELAANKRPFKSLENTNIHRDGSLVVMETSGVPILDDDGELLGYRGTDRDITQRKLSKEELEERIRTRTATLERAEAIAHVGSWDLDILNDELNWSDETYRIFGLPVGASMDVQSFFACIHPDDAQFVSEAWNKALEGELYQIDHRIVTPLGVRWVHERAEMTFDADMRAIAAHGAVQDITERKNIEQALTESKHRAEQLAETKSAFLANMSHEIRTPINAVMGLARIGERDAKTGESEETFSQILNSSEHLLGIINDILDYSRAEAGKVKIAPEPILLRAFVQSVVDLLKERAASKGLAFAAEFEDGLPEWVAGDQLRLKQVIMNLLSNAFKFTEQGAVTLAVTRRGEITYFSVSDTGIGMSKDELSRLFTPFEQADSSTTRKYGGTGLGLAISQNLAGLMDGEISVESKPGVGSVFMFSLPLPESDAPNTIPQPVSEPDAMRENLYGVKILAAEDVEINRLILEDILVSEGASVVFAENGSEVLDLLDEHGGDAFDVILMDVQMPIMDGYEATRRLSEIHPDIPIIGLTAHALAEEREKCLAAGMVAHLTKPIEPDVLSETVRRHLH